jgi:hypothetical protein
VFVAGVFRPPHVSGVLALAMSLQKKRCSIRTYVRGKPRHAASADREKLS